MNPSIHLSGEVQARPSGSILNVTVDARRQVFQTSAAVIGWAQSHSSRYVCVATVNNVMEAWDSPEFRAITNAADLVTPDGMPLVWALKLLGFPNATRVYGPDLTPLVLARRRAPKYPGRLLRRLARSPQPWPSIRHPRAVSALQIAYAFSPPFRPLTPVEDEEIVAAINRSGARILFIGLNTPKQDYWMAAHRGRVQAVMLGVGAAFDFIAGTKRQAPRWMMRIGMEWFFRLATEPRRLWKRYLKHNPRFIVLFAFQLLSRRRGQPFTPASDL